MSADHGSSHHDDGPPPPPEPKTPMWLPALGAALFLLVGLWWATRPEPPAPIASDSADGGAIVEAGPAAQGNPQGAPPPPQVQAQGQAQAAPPQGAPPHGGPPPRPAGSGIDTKQLTPAQAAQLQKVLKGAGH